MAFLLQAISHLFRDQFEGTKVPKNGQNGEEETEQEKCSGLK
jgi:hypothetical protein